MKYTVQLPDIKEPHPEYLQIELTIFERQTAHAEGGQTSDMWKGEVTLIELPSYVRNNLSSTLQSYCTVPISVKRQYQLNHRSG